MPRIHTAVVPNRTEKISFFCRDEHENPLPSPVLETGPVHLAPGDTVVIQVPMNDRGERPLVIYIAGPYSAPTLAERKANTRQAMNAFLAILARGHYPICPHLSHYPHEYHIAETQREIPYNVWIDLDRQYLIRSDAIYYMAPSPGADGELRLAKRCGKIVFRSMDEVPDLTGNSWWKGLIPVEKPEIVQVWKQADAVGSGDPGIEAINGVRLCPECSKRITPLFARFEQRDQSIHGVIELKRRCWIPPLEDESQPDAHLENPVPPGGGTGQ